MNTIYQIIKRVFSGTSANGSVTLTNANQWYQIPDTVPTNDYLLIATIETGIGNIRWSTENGGTPGSSNGNLAPGDLSITLAGGHKLYYASDTANDVINWTTKEI